MSIIPSAARNDTTTTAPDEDSHEAAVARYLSAPYTDDVTPESMTPDRVNDIRTRELLATRGPWGLYDSEDGFVDIAADLKENGTGYSCRRSIAQLEADLIDNDPAHADWSEGEEREQVLADAEFIAHAREDVPALLAEVDRLRAELDKVTAFCAQRAEYVTSILNCHPDNKHDYYRWQGHAESRRQLSERLGLPVGWPAEDAVEADPTKATRMQDAQDTIADLRKAGA